MSILGQAASRTRAALAAIAGRTTSAVSGVVAKGTAIASAAAMMAFQFQVSYERSQVHRDMHRMDEDDEVVKYALDVIASRSTGMEDPTLFAFEATVQAAKRKDGSTVSGSVVDEAQWEIQQLIDRAELQQQAWQIVRRFVKFGNEFSELVVDWKTNDVVRLETRPEHTMWPKVDERGNRLPGYTQKPEWSAQGKEAIEFSEWEVLHFAFGELNGYIGTPLLKCARKNHKRLNLAEDSTATARLTRAFVRWLHHVPIKDDWTTDQAQKAIDAYKTKMTELKVLNQNTGIVDKQESPMSVHTDMFVPDVGDGRGKVEMFDPENAQLQNITDVKYFLDRLITATTLPKRFYPFEGSTPKLSEGGGQAEDKNFACTLMMCQSILKAGFLQLFKLQLLLKGINPNDVRIVIRMSEINTTDQLRAAQTQLALSKVMTEFTNKFPEMRNYLPVILREYTRMSDQSKAELADMKVESLPEPAKPTPGEKRISLPESGKGADRAKV